jgi:hypothetical protein
MLRYLVVAMAISFAPRVVDATCAVASSKAFVLTPPNTVIEDGGGVLVMATGYPVRDRDIAAEPTWAFVAAGKRIKPTIDVLAPGLDLYRLPESSATEVILESGTHARIVGVRRSVVRDASRLPAPVVQSIDTVEDFTDPRFGSVVTTAHFPTPAPAGAAMLVIYKVDDHGVRKPIAFGAVRDGDREVIVYHSAHCTVQPAGTEQPIPGTRAVVAWIDRSGRTSAPSKAIDVVIGRN